jgi:predicted RND superfamily exporter protein
MSLPRKHLSAWEPLPKAISKIPGVRRVLSLPGIKGDMDLTARWTPEEFRDIIGPIALFKQNFLSEDQKTTVMSVILDDVPDKTPLSRPSKRF